MAPGVPITVILIQAGRPLAQLRSGRLGWRSSAALGHPCRWPASPLQSPGGERAEVRQPRPPGTRKGVRLASFRFPSGRVCSLKFAYGAEIIGNSPARTLPPTGAKLRNEPISGSCSPDRGQGQSNLVKPSQTKSNQFGCPPPRFSCLKPPPHDLGPGGGA